MVVLWSSVDPVSEDAPLCGAAACEFADSVYLFGGFQRDAGAPTAELRHCVFDLDLQQWRAPELLDVDGAVPTPRAGCTVTRINATVYLFGGQQVWPEEQLNDLYAASIVRPGTSEETCTLSACLWVVALPSCWFDLVYRLLPSGYHPLLIAHHP